MINLWLRFFPKDFRSKVSAITWQEIELSDYSVTVNHVNHYATGTFQLFKKCKKKKKKLQLFKLANFTQTNKRTNTENILENERQWFYQ